MSYNRYANNRKVKERNIFFKLVMLSSRIRVRYEFRYYTTIIFEALESYDNGF